MQMYRQGNVLLVEVSMLPVNIQKQGNCNNRNLELDKGYRLENVAIYTRSNGSKVRDVFIEAFENAKLIQGKNSKSINLTSKYYRLIKNNHYKIMDKRTCELFRTSDLDWRYFDYKYPELYI
jgi:hypothetical protein